MVQTDDRAVQETDLASVSGIVLAGTYQWTGSTFEALRPRPLLPVAQKPLIEYVLGWLKTSGVPQAIICANGSTDALRRHLDARQALLRVGYHEDGSPRGAAGCVKDAAATSAANTFIVTDGTTIPTVDVPRLLAHHGSTGAALTIVVHQRSTSGQPHFEPTGTYVFNRDVLDGIPATSFQDIKENLIPRMYREGQRIEVFAVSEMSPRVLNATSYLAMNRWMIQRLVGSGATEYTAHPSAWIDEHATIVGPVVMGAGVRVHAGATIVGPASIGAGTIVESGAVVSRSVTWDNCQVRGGAVVDQSLLADNTMVAAGSYVTSEVRVSAPERRPWLSQVLTRKTAPTGVVVRPALS